VVGFIHSKHINRVLGCVIHTHEGEKHEKLKEEYGVGDGNRTEAAMAVVVVVVVAVVMVVEVVRSIVRRPRQP